MVLFLAGGTVYGLLFRTTQPHITVIDDSEEIYTPVGETMFTGMGRLRLVSADNPPVTIVISVVFPFTPEDRPFTEELVGKVPELRRITEEYFGALSARQIQSTHEEIIKDELLYRYNSILRLGGIGILYFNDFMLIE